MKPFLSSFFNYVYRYKIWFWFCCRRLSHSKSLSQTLRANTFIWNYLITGFQRSDLWCIYKNSGRISMKFPQGQPWDQQFTIWNQLTLFFSSAGLAFSVNTLVSSILLWKLSLKWNKTIRKIEKLESSLSCSKNPKPMKVLRWIIIGTLSCAIGNSIFFMYAYIVMKGQGHKYLIEKKLTDLI